MPPPAAARGGYSEAPEEATFGCGADAEDDEEEAYHQLPSLGFCTSAKMEEVDLNQSRAQASSGTAQNAKDPNPGTAWVSAAADESPAWWVPLPRSVSAPVSLVVLHAATKEGAGALPEDKLLLENVIVEVMATMPEKKSKEPGTAAWASSIQSAAPVEKKSETDRLFFFIPSVKGRGIRVKKATGAKGPLALRAVQVFIMPAAKYKLSKTILTIDKYAVAQAFPLAELAHTTAYKNLYTASAVQAVGAQESFVEEKEQEALNLCHHLSGIWDPAAVKFNHGEHKQTVMMVMLSVMEHAKQIFAMEPKLVDVKAPCYVFGDIHGNFEDLLYFTSNLIPFKHVKYASHGFVFLGDYVDRGPHDVECLAYLLSLKVQAPSKMILLRGNHEDRRQNASLKESFRNHCHQLFGAEGGEQVWIKANEVFDMMPLCSVIDNRIFCCHGGIPRVPRDAEGQPMRIRQVLEKVPQTFSQVGDNADPYLQAATDLLWADPSQDSGGRKEEYFERNEARGCSCCFGQKAVDEFLEFNNLEYFMRAHQFFSFGVNISKGGKVITLFSSSNYCDHSSCAGCALVATDDRIQLLMKEHQAPAGQ